MTNEETDFNTAVKDSKDEFVMMVKLMDLPTDAKVIVENFIIMHEQLNERWKEHLRLLSEAGEVPTDWTEVQPDGCVHVPDELDPLVNKIAMQMRFHTISGKSEGKTVCDIAYIAQVFFHKYLAASLLSQQQRHDKEMEDFAEWRETNAYKCSANKWQLRTDPNNPNYETFTFAALLARFREKG